MDNTFWSNFLSNFLANFLSDLIVGAGLGAFLAWWVGKRITNFERSQLRKDEKRAEFEKATRYLEFLKEEIRYLLTILPNSIDGFEKTGYGQEVIVPTPFWDILQPSGELPKLLQPNVLKSLTLCSLA